MKLGWSVLVIASMIAVTGPLVAIRSIRLAPSQVIFDWPGPQFLLIMYTEIALYVVFVAIGVFNRKRPRIHRPMMLLASLVILTGATGRIPLINSTFGIHHWMALFGPVVSLGAVLLLVRMAMTRRFDREFAAGLAALVVVTVVASGLAVTNVWVNWAGIILKL
jgi:asparagine N-glycosylation enzyme membrane subunit Stt3